MRTPTKRGGTAGRVTRDCAEQVARVAREAALAERHRIARDLHDSVNQTLVSLQFAVQAAADLWDTQPAQAHQALDVVCHLSTAATAEMRAVLVDLHDAVLERQGLVAALEAYIAVLRRHSGLEVELRVAGLGARLSEADVPGAHQQALYRLVQEALANVVKHARASHATVTLERQRVLRLSIADNGVGFGTQVPPFAYGLTGMRERVEELGGRLHLENGPNGGARLVAELPLPDAA
jgi:NarL family two-component system sensor histidine kinase LiaS